MKHIDPLSRRRNHRLYLLDLLEPRVLLSSDVLANHYDFGSTGQVLDETTLTPATVGSTQGGSSISNKFGRKFDTTLDGQVYAQVLAREDVNITRGSNQGVHNVLYVATMHDSLYAVDANSGVILWQDSFLQIADPRVGTIGNPIATAGATTFPATSGNNVLINGNDIGPELGILSTPVIDASTNVIYLETNSQELRNGNTPADLGADRHFVQRLWAINLSDGSVAITPNNPSFEPTSGGQVIGDVIKNDTISSSNYKNYQYVVGPYIKGTGNNNDTFNADGTVATTNNADGWTTNSADTTSIFAGSTPSAKGYIAFNALLQMNRVALTLINHVIYIGFASHGDAGPYYGWLLGYSATNLGNVSAFVTVPTFDGVKGSAGFTSVGGLWGAGATLTYDGTYLYFTVGNGSFNPATSNFSSSYFSMDGANKVLLPRDSDYGDSVLKVAIDPNATQANVNLANAAAGNPTPNGAYNPDGGYTVNGYGLKVVDFFTPSNVWELNINDEDIGSSGVLLIPTSGPGGMTAPDGDAMLVLAGKEGRIYLLDAGNLGGYNTQYITDGHQTAGAKGNTSDPTANPAPYDNILGEYYYAQAHGVTDGTTHLVVVANNQTNKGYAIPSYFNGRFYLALGGTPQMGFNISSFLFPTGVAKANRTAIYTSPAFVTGTTGGSANFGPRGSTAAISANVTSNPIIWNTNVNQNSSDYLIAYDTSANVLFNSNWTLPGGANNTLTNGVTNSTGIKFGIPTVFNGMVCVGTGGGSGLSGVRLGTITGYATFTLVNNTPVYTAAPGTPPQPALAAASDTGTSSSDRITNDSTPTFTGTAAPNSTVSILIDGQSKGLAIAGNDGTYSVTTSALADGTHTVVALDTNVNGASPTSTSLTIAIDTQAPQLNSKSFSFTGSSQQIQTLFNKDVTPSIQVTDLNLINNTTATTIPSSELSLSLNAAAHSATWTFLNPGDNALPDGAYTATVPASMITDIAGNHPSLDVVLPFTFLNADPNLDQVVNALDFNVLATNFGAASATFVQGDFNYDGSVNTNDFTILADRFGNHAASSPAATEAAQDPARAASMMPMLFNSASQIRPDWADPVGSALQDLL